MKKVLFYAMLLFVATACKNEEPSQQKSGHDYVDLGLPSGLKWATCNVGASIPEEYGAYFAWGETSPKTLYIESTYKWCNGPYDTKTKYCTSDFFGIVDNKTTLDPEDDAAHVNWGGAWRMPTKAEQDELRNNSTWTWTTDYNGTGVRGYIVKSNVAGNNNSIFLPAAGSRTSASSNNVIPHGYYWSSSLDEYVSNLAYYLNFSSGRVDWLSSFRFVGFSVRPVCK